LIYQADYIVTLNGDPIKNGAIRILNNRIEEVGTREQVQPENGEFVRVLPETILMPGLLNSHCHLELGHVRGLLPEKESYSMWVARLQHFLASTETKGYEENIRLGALECLHFGTTTVVDIGNTLQNFKMLPKSPIRSYSVYEALGLHPEKGLDYFKKYWKLSQQKLRAKILPERCMFSVGAHAPYSCSPELLNFVVSESKKLETPFVIHGAEGLEEQELFAEEKGRLYEFCKRRYPKVPYEKGKESLEYLLANNWLPNGSIVAHGNTIKREVAVELAKRSISLVHCPRSREFFGHPEFPFEMCYNAGVNICLGTDSLASNDNYNLFDEMAEFRRIYPQIECEKILELVTLNGAKAVGRERELGRIAEGYLADIIGIRLHHNEGTDIYDEIVCEDHDVEFVLVDGEEVII